MQPGQALSLPNWCATLPNALQATIAGVALDIINYPGTTGLAVIGSVAEGVYDTTSDVDMLYVRDPKIPNEVIHGIKDRWPLAQFISRTPGKLWTDFRTGNIAAWSLARGQILYDPARMLERLVAHEPPRPSRAWIAERRAYVEKWPSDVQGLWRKTLNLSVLLLAQRGIVVTTKHQLCSEFSGAVDEPLLRRAVEIVCVRGERARLQYCAAEMPLLSEAVDRLLAEINSHL